MVIYVILQNMQSTDEQRYTDEKTHIDTPQNGCVLKLNSNFLEEKSVYVI